MAKKKRNQKKKSSTPKGAPQKQVPDVNMTLGAVANVFLSICLLISCLFADLDKVHVLLPLAVIVLGWTLLSLLKTPWTSGSNPLKDPKSIVEFCTPSYLLFCLMILTPFLMMLFSKWGAEFPFEGDYDHHTYAAIAGAGFWKSQWWVLLLFFSSFFWAPKISRKYWSFGLLAGVCLLSYITEAPQYYFARYPGAAYLFDAPFVWMAQALEWEAIINASRLGTLISVFVWLFVARPILFEKPLSWGFITFAIALLFQQSHILFFTSPYLEPWAMIMIFSSMEILYTRQNRNLLALLLVGLATMFKESAILVLPFVAFHLWTESRTSQERKNLTLLSMVSALPFIIYFAYRKISKIWRQTEFSGFSEAFSPERLNLGLNQYLLHHYTTGFVFLVALAFGFFLAWRSSPRIRKLTLLLWAGAVFQFLFFFMDKLTIDYPMYSRFNMLVLTLMAGSFLALKGFEKKPGAKTVGALILVVIGVSLSLLNSLSLAAGEPYYRNSLDLPRSPEHYPIKTLIEKVETTGNITKRDTIFINFPKERFIIQSMKLGYRSLVSKYRFGSDKTSYLAPKCDCRELKSHILLPLGYPTETNEKRVRTVESCIQAMKSTCVKVLEHRLPDGTPVGYIGTYK